MNQKKQPSLKRRPTAEKRARQSEERRIRNSAVKSRIRTERKKLEQYIQKSTPSSLDQSTAQLSVVYSVVDKAAKKGIIHRNKASRMKKRASKRLASQTV